MERRPKNLLCNKRRIGSFQVVSLHLRKLWQKSPKKEKIQHLVTGMW